MKRAATPPSTGAHPWAKPNELPVLNDKIRSSFHTT